MRIATTPKKGGDDSPPALLLNRFVSCEDSELRVAGSEPYLAEIFSCDQHHQNESDTDNNQGDNHRLFLFHSLLLLDPKVGKRLTLMGLALDLASD